MLYIVVERSADRGEHELVSVNRFLKNDSMIGFFQWSDEEKVRLLEQGTLLVAETKNVTARYTMQHTMPSELMAAATKPFTAYVETSDGEIRVLHITPEDMQ